MAPGELFTVDSCCPALGTIGARLISGGVVWVDNVMRGADSAAAAAGFHSITFVAPWIFFFLNHSRSTCIHFNLSGVNQMGRGFVPNGSITNQRTAVLLNDFKKKKPSVGLSFHRRRSGR